MSQEVCARIASVCFEKLTSQKLEEVDPNEGASLLKRFLVGDISEDENIGAAWRCCRFIIKAQSVVWLEEIAQLITTVMKEEHTSLMQAILSSDSSEEARIEATILLNDLLVTFPEYRNLIETEEVIQAFSVPDANYGELIHTLYRLYQVENKTSHQIISSIEQIVFTHFNLEKHGFDTWLKAYRSIYELSGYFHCFRQQAMYQETIDRFLSQFPPTLVRKYFEAWTSPREDDKKIRVIIDNLKIIYELEQTHPGYVRQLYRYFGRVEFSAQPFETIQKQLEDATSEGVKIIELKDTSDHNGASKHDHDFSQWHQLVERWASENPDDETIQELLGLLSPSEVKKITFEADSLITLYLRLRKLYDHFQPDWKVLCVIVQVHGSNKRLAFRDGLNALTIEQVVGTAVPPEFEKLRSEMIAFFRQLLGAESQIILLSCSTGKVEGNQEPIAKGIARMLKAKVIAPVEDAWEHLSWDAEAMNMNVEFFTGNRLLGEEVKSVDAVVFDYREDDSAPV